MGASQRDLLAAQLCIWVFGLLALLIVLLLIRKSITSLRSHIKKVTERLPWYHDDESLGSPISPLHSPAMDHKDSTVDSIIRNEEPLEGGLHTGSDADKGDYSPPGGLYIRGREPLVKSGAEHDPLKKLRVGRKDRKKAGDGLRGKNVTEAFRVKEKDLKRTMK